MQVFFWFDDDVMEKVHLDNRFMITNWNPFIYGTYCTVLTDFFFFYTDLVKIYIYDFVVNLEILKYVIY